MFFKSVGVIGTGQLGLVLATKLNEIGFLAWTCNRNNEKRQFAEKLIPKTKHFKSIEEINYLPDIIFVTVSDTGISDVSSALSYKFGGDLSGKIVIHCSGVFGREVLEYCSDMGADTVSAHPYQTFYRPEISVLSEIAWGIDCPNQSKPIISSLIENLGGKAVFLSQNTIDLKPIYHISAVAASNYLSTTIQLAKHLADKAEINPKEFIEPITKTTLENSINSLNQANSFPLTGPIARADAEAIKSHIEALSDNKYLLRTYCHLGLATLEMSLHHSIINKKQFLELQQIFNDALSL